MLPAVHSPKRFLSNTSRASVVRASSHLSTHSCKRISGRTNVELKPSVSDAEFLLRCPHPGSTRCMSTASLKHRKNAVRAGTTVPVSKRKPSASSSVPDEDVSDFPQKSEQNHLKGAAVSNATIYSGSHFSTRRKELQAARTGQKPKRKSLKVQKSAEASLSSAEGDAMSVRELSSNGTKGKETRLKRGGFRLNELGQLPDDASKDASKEDWKNESWKDDWGQDELVPQSQQASLFERNAPPHLLQKLPTYNCRVEGLISPSVNDTLEEIEPPMGKGSIATLAHGLDRVLFNPGIHWVQDPRSRVYNFSPLIQRIPDIKDFAFERLTPFIKSSRDTVLRDLAIAKGKRFTGSTSSLSGLLSHIYFLISQDHPVDTSCLCKPFSYQPTNFTPGQRMPTAVVFNQRNGIYMIDSDNTDDDDSQWNILLWMGTMLENFLTQPKDTFKRLLRSQGPAEVTLKTAEAYRYSQSKTFVMRSQLDSHDARLPGSGVFDIKTRAALPLRMDNLNFKENSGYRIASLRGDKGSFDREYYDLIRSAFLKYSFQARIGNMDGIFIAYHNTARIFGFQYVPLEELDERLFGAKDRGWRVFDKCVGLLEVVAEEIVNCFPGKSVACLAETLENSKVMRIWVQPVEDITGEEPLPEPSTNPTMPIIQLDITAESYLDEVLVDGRSAVNDVQSPWTLHWSVSRSSLSNYAIRQNLEAAKSRKFRPTTYPTGVHPDNLEEFLNSLGFGKLEIKPDANNFAPPDLQIEALRKIARAGQLETDRLEEEDRRKGLKMWQQFVASDPNYHHPFGHSNFANCESAGQNESINAVESGMVDLLSIDRSKDLSEGSLPSVSVIENVRDHCMDMGEPVEDNQDLQGVGRHQLSKANKSYKATSRDKMRVLSKPSTTAKP